MLESFFLLAHFGSWYDARVVMLDLVSLFPVIGTLMYALAWYFYVPAPTANEDDAEKSPGEKNILITDDPPVKKIEEDNVSLHSVGKLVA